MLLKSVLIVDEIKKKINNNKTVRVLRDFVRWINLPLFPYYSVIV